MKYLKFNNIRANSVWLLAITIIFSHDLCISQVVKLDTNKLETNMRVLWTPDRAQYAPQWLLFGTFPAKWDDGLDTDFLSTIGGEANIRPQEGQSVKFTDGTERTWRMLSNPTKIIDLADFFSGTQTENVVCYAYGIINRNSAGRTLLTLGSDDAVKVWLNGKLVHRNHTYRGVVIDQDLVDVDLKQGENYLLFKILQGTGGWAFTTRILDDANILENTVQKPLVTLNDNPYYNTFTIKSSPLYRTITKQQFIKVQIYFAGGKSVLEKTIQRGDSIFVNYKKWENGLYEIKYTYPNLTGLSSTEYLNWVKGDLLPIAQNLVKTAPANSTNTSEEITHSMLANYVTDRLGGNLVNPNQSKYYLLYPPLMEFTEMKANNQIRPGGFIRLAYVDEIDGTPQFCRCYIPSDYDPSKKTAMVVYLHGYNQGNPHYINWWNVDKRHDLFADRYNYILIEPHGRGNTQYFGIGDHDVMKCIQMAKEKLNIDNDRIYLTGESMGGGGTWRIASVHPEMFAAIAPVYGGWDHRSYMNKGALKKLSETDDFFLDKSNSTCQFESLLNLPILALHGDNDRTVDVENTRYLVRMLQRWGYNIRYFEVPGKGHENLEKGDIIYPWLLQHTRNANPKQVRVRAADIRTASAYWVNVTLRNNDLKMINVEAEILENNIMRVNSENVLEMVLSPNEQWIQPNKPVNVIWNGEILTFDKLTNNSITLRNKGVVMQKLHKTPQIAGPISDFTNTPFALVVGTISKDIFMQKIIKLKVDAFVAYWKNWQKFEPRIFKDTEISEAELKSYSLFLIGGPQENMISQRIEKLLPFEIKSTTITIHDTVFQAKDAYIEAVYPNPFNVQRYIRLVAPTSDDGMILYNPNNSSYSNYDYMIMDNKILKQVMAGTNKKNSIIIGFFDYNWKLDSSYLKKGD